MRRGRVLLAGAGLVVLLTPALAGCGTAAKPSTEHASTPAGDESYGPLPTFLPKNAIHPDSVLTGTAARPALTTEGDAVRVQLRGGSVLITVTGPQTPGQGLPYQAPATTCTWTVNLTEATGRVPIAVADFSTLDHLGAVDRPVPVPSRSTLPTSIGPGQTVQFQLRGFMRIGEGLLRWAPGGAGGTIASWDFAVETD